MELDISWPGGQSHFKPDDSPVRIGRSSDSSLQVSYASASRNHLEIVWNGTAWTVTDISAHGTFGSNGTRLEKSWQIVSDFGINLGGPEGEALTIKCVSPNVELATQIAPEALAEGPPPLDENSTAVFDVQPPPPGQVVEEKVAANPQTVQFDFDAALNVADGGAANVAAQPPAADSGQFMGQPVADASQTFASAESTNVYNPAAVVEAPGVSLTGTAVMPDPNMQAGAPLAPSPTVMGGQNITLTVDDQDYSFTPGTDITIGRDPACMVPVDERHALVSRNHVRIVHRQGNWWIEDTSSRGTFIDTNKLIKPYKAEGAFMTHLGDDTAGIPMRVVTAGQHRVKKNFSYLPVIALVAALLVPLGLILWVYPFGGSEQATDLPTTKQATVMLIQENSWGTGFFITDDLIVTNQHVADQADEHYVAVSREIDQPAEVEYIAELFAKHDFLDVAVLKVTKKVDISGAQPKVSPVDPAAIDIRPLKLGDSDTVVIGDNLSTAGFPAQFSSIGTDELGNTELPPVAINSGDAASFRSWPSCDEPNPMSGIPVDNSSVTCSPLSSIDKGVLVASFANGQGGSGSAVLSGNEVVAILFATSVEDDNANLTITSNAFKGFVDRAIKAEE